MVAVVAKARAKCVAIRSDMEGLLFRFDRGVGSAVPLQSASIAVTMTVTSAWFIVVGLGFCSKWWLLLNTSTLIWDCWEANCANEKQSWAGEIIFLKICSFDESCVSRRCSDGWNKSHSILLWIGIPWTLREIKWNTVTPKYMEKCTWHRKYKSHENANSNNRETKSERNRHNNHWRFHDNRTTFV